MQINVRIISVSKPANVAKGKNKWTEIVVEYEGDKGVQKRKFPSFNKELYELVQELKTDFSYDVELKKEGDYWNWTAIDLDSATKGSSKKDSPAKGKDSSNTWDLKNQLDRERFGFEKQKQILIIRQSMVAAAAAIQGVGADPEVVINVADVFVHYVLAGQSEEVEVVQQEEKEVVEEAPKRSRKTAEVE